MFPLDATPGRNCFIKGREFLFFSGYSYLGMNHVSHFTDLVKEGIDKYGVLFPSSRISNTQLKLYGDFEKELSTLISTEETVSFSSGYLAGKTIADILSAYKNVFTAPGTHPAIKSPTHEQNNSSFTEWAHNVLNTINNSNEKDFVIISDSVNIMQSVIYNFSFVKEINRNKKIILLIDDSHAVGILGSKGEGIISRLPVKNNIEYIITYSLSKAFNIEGGAVSCSKYFADILRKHPNYTASTAINPSLAFAFINSQEIYQDQRKKLIKNIKFVNENLPGKLLAKNDSSLPIFIAKAKSAEKFLKNNIVISSFNYPNPQSDKYERAIINALHTKSDLQTLLAVN